MSKDVEIEVDIETFDKLRELLKNHMEYARDRDITDEIVDNNSLIFCAHEPRLNGELVWLYI